MRFFLTALAMAVFLWPGFSQAGTYNQGNQERTMLPMQQTELTPGVKIPPLDAAVPVKTETATFALG
jgi:hypothetical protein